MENLSAKKRRQSRNRSRIVLALSTIGLAYPALGPAAETGLWEPKMPAMMSAPTARREMAMAYDSMRHQTVLYGGYSDALGGSAELWEWDGSMWNQVTPQSSTTPDVRFSTAMAYDSDNHVMLLFGGFDSSFNFQNELWAWDGSSMGWTQLCATAPCNTTVPSPRRWMQLAYDSTRHRLIMFGGIDDTYTIVGDTWEWDGTAWHQACTSAPCNTSMPPSRRAAGMAFDSRRNVTVLFGGVDTSYYNDTWEWNGTAWTNACQGTCSATVPDTRQDPRIVFDDVRGKTVLFGGYNGDLFPDTWEWNGTAWTQTATSGPPSRFRAGMAFDSFRSRTVLFGGNDGSDDLDDTWEYHATGGGCLANSECNTGHCVDGVCCQTEGCGTCETCSGTMPGTCTSVQSAMDADSCIGSCNASGTCTTTCANNSGCATGHFCSSGACVPTLGNGQACGVNAQCSSGHCADQVCCDTACDQVCDRCTTNNHVGTCLPDPSGEHGEPACDPYLCNGTSTSCPTSCTSNSQCSSDARCRSGQCVALKANGVACQNASECVSDFCVDGLCCATACEGACNVCNGSVPGACTMAAAGAAGAPSCGAYVCDGANATCPASCSSDQNCAAGGSCRSGQCTVGTMGGVDTGTTPMDSGGCSSLGRSGSDTGPVTPLAWVLFGLVAMGYRLSRRHVEGKIRRTP